MPDGKSDQVKAGEISLPSQVNCLGMSPWWENAGDSSFIVCVSEWGVPAAHTKLVRQYAQIPNIGKMGRVFEVGINKVLQLA